jgi:predicted dehydrogenase
MKDKAIEAVVIATNVSMHYQIAKEALLNGKHIFVEKPLADNSIKAEELLKLSQKHRRILMVDHTFIFSGAVRQIKNLISKNKLGKLLYYDSVRINLGIFQQDVDVVWDLATHDLSILDYFFKKNPKVLSAIGCSHVNNIKNSAYVSLDYGNDFIAHIHVSWLAPVKIRQILICGTKKMIVYNDIEPTEKLRVYSKRIEVINSPEKIYRTLIDYRIGDVYIPNIETKEALKNSCSHFIECIIKNKVPITDGKAGLRVVKTLEDIERQMVKK